MTPNDIERDRIIDDIKHTHVYIEGQNVIVRVSDNVTFVERAFNCSYLGRGLSEIDRLCNLDRFDEDQAEEKDGRKVRDRVRGRAAWDIIIDELTVATTCVNVHGGERMLYDYQINGATHQALNLWRGSLLQPADPYAPGDADPWVKHVEAIMGESAHTILDWFAWIVQHNSEKVRWAPLIYSQQGIGKDTMVAPIHAIFGHHNTVEVDARAIDSSFNSFDQAKLVILNELEADTRYTIYTKLKPKISGTGSGMVQVNEKHKSPFWARNVSAWVVFTNDPEAMPMEADDRRFFVTKGVRPCSIEDQADYYGKLWDWYRNQDGYAKVYAYLIRRDVSAFNSDQPPASTMAKAEMQIAAMTPEGRWAESLVSVGKLANRTVTTTLEIECIALEDGVHIKLNITSKRLRQGMTFAGWEEVARERFDAGTVPSTSTMWWIKKTAVIPRRIGAMRKVMVGEMPEAMLRKLASKG